jgi:hypothetical protein|tara:strand:+ start:1275 stop:1376 length:102 start_codon:yes stop_codon:yes gene_type:complete
VSLQLTSEAPAEIAFASIEVASKKQKEAPDQNP